MGKKKIQRWISIFEKVNEFMERNLDKWNTIDAIRKTYDKFIKNLKKIKDLQPELEQDLTPIMEELSRKRDALLEKLVPIGNILDVYSQDQNISEKARSLASDWKKVGSLGIHRLLDHSSGIQKLMDKYLNRTWDAQQAGENGSSMTASVDDEHRENKPGDALAGDSDSGVSISIEKAESGADIRGYGLTRFMLDELHTAIQQYRSALKLHDDVLGYRKKVRRKRDGLIRMNRKLLKNRLDKLMTVFSGTHPSFYLEYSNLTGKKSSG
jgi:flagellar biosynthesis chaperone FliJ